MNKKTWIALGAMLLLVAVMLTVFFVTRPETEAGAKEITVTVIHSDGSSKNYTYHTDEEYLGAALLAEGLIAGYEGDWGFVVETVDGEDAKDWNVAYWCWYIGEPVTENMGPVAISEQPIQDGDSYTLKYEKI